MENPGGGEPRKARWGVGKETIFVSFGPFVVIRLFRFRTEVLRIRRIPRMGGQAGFLWSLSK